MFHFLFMGMLLGWGAAIPIGPINLEIIRRNLNQGLRVGLSFGLGACIADVFYLLLLLFGVLVFFNEPFWLSVLSILGALVLAWYGIRAFKKPVSLQQIAERPYGLMHFQVILQHGLQGFLMTVLNPMTVIFWLSVSTQLAHLTVHHTLIPSLLVGLGVLFGAASWDITLNLIVHFTHHQISLKVRERLNYAGGIILLGFAVIGLYRGIHTL